MRSREKKLKTKKAYSKICLHVIKSSRNAKCWAHAPAQLRAKRVFLFFFFLLPLLHQNQQILSGYLISSLNQNVNVETQLAKTDSKLKGNKNKNLKKKKLHYATK